MSSDLTAEIAVENTAYSFDKPFSYLIPQNLLHKCKKGVRVLVPFGRGNKKRQGIVLNIFESENEGLKSIFSVLDDEPVLSAEMIETACFMKE